MFSIVNLQVELFAESDLALFALEFLFASLIQVFFSHMLLHISQIMRGEGALVAIIAVLNVVVVNEGIELVLRSTHAAIRNFFLF